MILEDKLQVEGILSMGYGLRSKILHKDRRLTIEAKEIYCYLMSYCGNGTTAYPSRNVILYDLKISKDRYYKYFNLLKEFGYIKVKQIKNGKEYSHNVYTIVNNPENITKLSCSENKDTENKDTNNNNTLITTTQRQEKFQPESKSNNKKSVVVAKPKKDKKMCLTRQSQTHKNLKKFNH